MDIWTNCDLKKHPYTYIHTHICTHTLQIDTHTYMYMYDIHIYIYDIHIYQKQVKHDDIILLDSDPINIPFFK